MAAELSVQIGMQELVAVVLGIETFAQQLLGTLVLNFVDNDGILHGIKNSGAAPEDVSVVVGKLWLQMSKLKIGWFRYRGGSSNPRTLVLCAASMALCSSDVSGNVHQLCTL